jgi:dihydrodipicolinate synthase/N-acetylneuraminate lyase
MIRGVLAAAVTPLRDSGAALDEDGVEPLVDFLAAGGVHGVLVAGTTGEGILLSSGERRRAAELFLSASRGRLDIAVHCGAQTTAETVELSAHAAEAGAAGVAVISPPYFILDEDALLEHLAAAAAASAPTAFYVYEFADRSGYAVPLTVIARLRERAPNFVGLKVSDTPFERFAPYLIEGLDVFVGPEALIHEGFRSGAVGAVSGLATAFPERVVAVVRAPSAEGAAEVGALRAAVSRFPFQSAVKWILGRRGVAVREDVRRPLRQLRDPERHALQHLLAESVEVPGAGA